MFAADNDNQCLGCVNRNAPDSHLRLSSLVFFLRTTIIPPSWLNLIEWKF
jgi:hypothetical protein